VRGSEFAMTSSYRVTGIVVFELRGLWISREARVKGGAKYKDTPLPIVKNPKGGFS